MIYGQNNGQDLTNGILRRDREKESTARKTWTKKKRNYNLLPERKLTGIFYPDPPFSSLWTDPSSIVSLGMGGHTWPAPPDHSFLPVFALDSLSVPTIIRKPPSLCGYVTLRDERNRTPSAHEGDQHTVGAGWWPCKRKQRKEKEKRKLEIERSGTNQLKYTSKYNALRV